MNNPNQIKRALQCLMGHTSRKTARCQMCAYNSGQDCYASAAQDALVYIARLEEIRRQHGVTNDRRRRIGYLYTVTDAKSGEVLVNDLSCAEAAKRLGYMSRQGFLDMARKAMAGAHDGLIVERRKGVIRENGPQKANAVWLYTVWDSDGAAVLRSVPLIKAAEYFDVAVGGLYSKLNAQWHADGKEAEFRGQRITRRKANAV